MAIHGDLLLETWMDPGNPGNPGNHWGLMSLEKREEVFILILFESFIDSGGNIYSITKMKSMRFPHPLIAIQDNL